MGQVKSFSKVNKLVKNISLYSITKIIPPAVGFALLPVYIAYTSKDEYGIIASMQILHTLCYVIFLLALDLAIVRIYHDYDKEYDKKVLLGTIFICTSCSSLIFGTILIIFNSYVNYLFVKIPFYPYYAITIGTAILSTFSVIPLVYYQIIQNAKRFVYLSFLFFLLTPVLTLYFVVVEKEGAIGYLKGDLFSKLIIAPIFIIISLHIVELKFCIRKFINTIKFSLPMIPGILSAWMLNLSDRVIIEKYFSLGELAQYSVAFKISSIILLLFGAVNMAYVPYFYEKAKQPDQTSAKNVLSFFNYIFVTVIIYGSFYLALYSNDIIGILLDSRYHSITFLIPIFVISVVLNLITGFINLMFNQHKKSIQLMLITLLGAVVNVILNYLLIPKYGLYGAAFTTLISSTLIFLFSLIFSRKYYYIKFKYKLIISTSMPLLVLTPFLIYRELFILKTLLCILTLFVAYLIIIYSYKKYNIKEQI